MTDSKPCEPCNGTGTVRTRTGEMWWQVQAWRCASCRGCGRVLVDEPVARDRTTCENEVTT